MLNVRQHDMAGTLDDVRCLGVGKLSGALTAEAQQELCAAIDRMDFQHASEREGEVSQDFDLLVVKLPLKDDPILASLARLSESYTALLRDQSRDNPWLADFAPSHVFVQRYDPESSGISPHRDGRRFIKLVSIFSLGSPAEFRLCGDRRGSVLDRCQLGSGDLILLGAPGFARRPAPGPLHSVSGPIGGVRYSITFRMERPA